MASWLPLARSEWDSLRIPVPGFTPKQQGGAEYTISLAGIVRRNDNMVWRPKSTYSKAGIITSMIVRLGGGSNSFSLAKLMHTAFAESTDLPTDDPRYPDQSANWIPWLRYDAPTYDVQFGTRTCAIDFVVLVPYYQMISFIRGNNAGPPETRKFDALGRDVPIPRQLLLDAGYKFSRLTGNAELVIAGQRVEIAKVHIA
jgi:hypothetical protein